MLRSSISVVFSLFLVIVLSCSEPEKEPYQLPENAIELISGEAGKTWKLARRFNDGTRMNMGDCFLGYRTTYKPEMTMNNNLGEHYYCGATLKANWEIWKSEKGDSYIKIKRGQLPELMGIEENFKLFRIAQLSKDQLTLQFTHNQYTKRKTSMINVLVPEDVEIKARDFHW